ncbi:MAG: DNA-binding transcriptional ArsR family regulator [Haloarculaceae archaeon]|jgi:DNA-binding transcriptional ArsR family regulator
MVPTDDTDCQVGRIALGTQLRDAFGIPRSGTDICYTLLADGFQSVRAIADRTGYEYRTVQTHLERLEADDLLDGAMLPREDGGKVAVYHTEREALPTTLLAFCLWATWAAGKSLETVDLTAAGQDPSTVFWTAVCDGDDQSVRC